MADEPKNKKRLGDLLVERGSLSQEDLNRAISVQQQTVMRLGEVLLKDGVVSKNEIGRALEQVQGIPYAECPPALIAPEVLALLPQSIALRCCALPLEVKNQQLAVAISEPQNLAILDELRFRAGISILPRFSFRDDILEGIRRFYQTSEQPEDAPEPGDEVKLGRDQANALDVQFIAADAEGENREAQKELRAGMRQRTPAVRFLSNVLAAAADKGASDIHIEPRVGTTIVRLRVDGMLREVMSIPGEHQAAVVSRVKILSNMDIAERRVPQDGRFLMQYHDRRLDMRISTLPTHFGEKVVIRLLDPRSSIITLDQLGFSPFHASELRRILCLPQGMLLVTGPTGSGKSTTLYGALNLLRAPYRNIVTVEDPVEYMLDGISQVQVHPKAGLTFASCLPSILRQDPDVIMVGEIRDGDTAEVALKASQTGHLVLSTLHTNNSIEAVTRLRDLGVPSYLVASSVTAILAQRLVRRLCDCRSKEEARDSFVRRLRNAGLEDPESCTHEYVAVGCSACDQTGYKGRVGIYEMLVVEGVVRDAVHAEARVETILGLARSTGFRTMQEDALEKIKDGLTSLEEVQRVVPWDSIKQQRCPSCSRETTPAFNYCPYCGTKSKSANVAAQTSRKSWQDKQDR